MVGEAIRIDGIGGTGALPLPMALPDAALTRALHGFVQRRLGHHADSDDVVQETWLRLFHHQSVSPVRNVKALCFTIARNLLLDHHRAAQRGARQGLDDDMVCPQPTAERVVAFRRAVEILASALETMPPLRREIFLRKRLDGTSTADICASLDMSAAAVEKHVVRAFHDLRTALFRRGFTMDAGA